MNLLVPAVLLLPLAGDPAPKEPPKRWMERLGRGVVAVPQGGKVFVGWRLLGTDPDDIAFHLYRVAADGPPVRLGRAPLTGATCYVDAGADLSRPVAYFVRPVLKGKEQEASAPFRLPANPPARPYLSIPLRTPDGYAAGDASGGPPAGAGEYATAPQPV